MLDQALRAPSLRSAIVNAGELDRQTAALQGRSSRSHRQRSARHIGAPLQAKRPDDLLQPMAVAAYVSTSHGSPARLNTASDDIVAAVGTVSAFDQDGLYERSASRPAGKIGEGH